MADTPSWLRPAFGPAVPETVRRQLDSTPDSGTLVPLLAGLVGVIFGIAGAVLLLTGAHPQGAAPVVFPAVAGGGMLLVALVALIACVRSAASQQKLRQAWEKWRDQVISRAELADIVEARPEIGNLLQAATAAVDDIRSSTAYRDGWLTSAFPEEAIQTAEWAVAVQARHAYRTGEIPATFSGQVDRLSAVRDEVRGLDRRIEEQRTKDLLARTLTGGQAQPDADCESALAVISDLSHLHWGNP
jgi:hypothetical protein